MQNIFGLQSRNNVNVALLVCSVLVLFTTSCKDTDRLNMPVVTGETVRPKVAVYIDMSYRLYPVTPEIMVVFAVWEDGRVIWSKDPIEVLSPIDPAEVDKPYRVGKIELSELEQFLDELERRGCYNDPALKQPYVGVDRDYMVIAVAVGNRQITMQSSHELHETLSKKVVWRANGSYVIHDGRSREEVLAEEPEEYKHFRNTWSEIRSSLEELIPEEGRIVEDLDFEMPNR